MVSAGTPVSSTNKTDHHDITEILLKVGLNTLNQTKPYVRMVVGFSWKVKLWVYNISHDRCYFDKKNKLHIHIMIYYLEIRIISLYSLLLCPDVTLMISFICL
jgi:hypothetical protein